MAADTLVVHCSDYRFRRVLPVFIEQALGIHDCDLLVVPGGPQLFASPDHLPKFGWAGERWTRFLVEAHTLGRIALVGHADCRWYRHVYGAQADLESRQQDDLRVARENLLRNFPRVAVETYLASLRDGKAYFQRLDLQGSWTIDWKTATA